MFDGKVILVTGGTGSFGRKFVRTILETSKPRKLIIFSRDEAKQFDMAQELSSDKYKCLRYFIGDVRDEQRLDESFRDTDIVVHAAALKQVPAAEYNPFEAIKTNILGAQNIIRACIKNKVEKVIALSTDKAASPINLYGATKLASDKLFIAANAMIGDHKTRFSVVRYGNVVGSRGSVIPFFMKKRHEGFLPITDERMTRFSITLREGVEFTMNCFKTMKGGEIFVPKIPSYKITEVAKAVAPEARLKVVGIRPGEKLHEVMIPEDEARNTYEFKDYFIIMPSSPAFAPELNPESMGGKLCADGFVYSSDKNSVWLSADDIKSLLKEVPDYN